jgi:hypothetical protein
MFTMFKKLSKTSILGVKKAGPKCQNSPIKRPIFSKPKYTVKLALNNIYSIPPFLTISTTQKTTNFRRGGSKMRGGCQKSPPKPAKNCNFVGGTSGPPFFRPFLDYFKKLKKLKKVSKIVNFGCQICRSKMSKFSHQTTHLFKTQIYCQTSVK